MKGKMVGGKGKGIGPAWTRGEIEKPAGEENMGTWTAAVYTPEQMARLNVDKFGEKIEAKKEKVQKEKKPKEEKKVVEKTDASPSTEKPVKEKREKKEKAPKDEVKTKKAEASPVKEKAVVEEKEKPKQ